jgi:hypothetical protein
MISSRPRHTLTRLAQRSASVLLMLTVVLALAPAAMAETLWPVSVQASEGQWTGEVATFSTEFNTGCGNFFCPPAACPNEAEWGATIFWGRVSDITAVTQSTSGTIVYTGQQTIPTGGLWPDLLCSYSVRGTHTFQEETSTPLPIEVDLATANGIDLASANTSGTATDASLTASAASISATQGSAFNGVVASFSDAAGGSTTSEFTATIDWGDGTQPTTGNVTARGGGQFDVAGAHTYAQRAPSVPVTVTIADVGGSRATAKGVAAVVDAPLTASGAVIDAVKAAQFSGPVARFSDGDATSDVRDLSASVDWADGTVSAGTIRAADGGGYSVEATHTYAQPGSYAVTVKLSDTGGSTTTANSTARVSASAASLTGASQPVAATEGTPLPGVVASFTSSDQNAAAGDFTATIAWGDGRAGNGVVTARQDGGFQVAGSHAYAEEDPSVPVTVTVTAADGGRTVISDTASVADASLSATVPNRAATRGTPVQGIVATFGDADPAGEPGDYVAAVSWGDGARTPGTVTARAGGGFEVSAAHTYSSAGAQTMSVTVTDVGGASTTARGTVTVADPAAASPLASFQAPARQLGTSVQGRVTILTRGSTLTASLYSRALGAHVANASRSGVLLGHLVKRRLALGRIAFAVALKANGRHMLRRQRTLPLTLRVTVTSPSGAASTRVIPVELDR